MVPPALREVERLVRFERAQRKLKRTGPSDPEWVPTLEIQLHVNVFYPVTLQREIFQ